MLSELNLYCHGYVAIPIIESCIDRGLFDLLETKTPHKTGWLYKKLGVNIGYFRIALRALESLGWIKKQGEEGYLLSEEADFADWEFQLSALYRHPFEELLKKKISQETLIESLERLLVNIRKKPTQKIRLIEGALMTSVFIAVKTQNITVATEHWDSLPNKMKAPLSKILVHKKWITGNVNQWRWSDAGKEIINKIGVLSIAASYRPMLAQMDTLLFGEAHRVFERSKSGGELHLERLMNVMGSGFQHGRYFKAVEKKMLIQFDKLPLKNQPRYIADMGCGDGSLLKHLYHSIKDKTLRGEHLDRYPLTLIGIDYNETALQETRKTLRELPHLALGGDINDPGQLIKDLTSKGIERPKQILHVRSFLDHNIRCETSQKCLASLKPLIEGEDGAYVAMDGHPLSSLQVLTAWYQHLKAWSKVISTGGLFMLESHQIPVLETKNQFERSENFYFDSIHAFSHQYLISAEALLVLAARAGLFCEVAPKRFPKTLGYCRITMTHFIKRDYVIRHAQKSDLTTLCEIEKKCWPKEIRTDKARIKARIKKYPQGQFVIEKNNQVIGVIYSQRIDGGVQIQKYTASTVDALHTDQGKVVQLLAVNVDPAMQDLKLGDQLLEFMLQRCSVMNGVQRVMGVTLCRDYKVNQSNSFKSPSFKEYIHQRDQQGRIKDPILSFHESHGATIGDAISNYRKEDLANEGYGVLVHYDIHSRKERRLLDSSQSIEKRKQGPSLNSQHSIKAFIRKAISKYLEDDNDDAFAMDRPIMEMGLCSADLLELQVKLQQAYPLDFESAFFFKYNTPSKIVTFIETSIDAVATVRESTGVDDYEMKENSSKVYKTINKSEKRIGVNNAVDIAIVGTSFKLPGGIVTQEALWELLAENRSAIGNLPGNRFSWPHGVDPKATYPGIDRGGFLERIAGFDAAFFRISPKEAEGMDPQQRILLELAWACLENAGIRADTIKGTPTGVYIGASGSDYSKLIQEAGGQIPAQYGTGSSMAALANRISYFLDISGPSIQIDTACSSSLVAVHHALQSIARGECRQALAGGINLICHPANSLAYYKAGMLSKDGRCKTFDANADGYVRSEGAVMIFLKPLLQAIDHGDNIYAVIKGSAINHGGLSGGLTVPNPQKQSQLLISAWKRAGIHPERLSCIEAHGTGTSLGDPIEIEGIKQAFAGFSALKKSSFCGMSSLKSNLGHLEAAAGIAGLLKLMMCLKNKQMPASINFSSLNPEIHLKNSPLNIITQNQAWPVLKDKPRCAAVSSFGSGGMNAHVVVEEYLWEYPIDERADTKNDTYLFLLSAKNKERLIAYAKLMHSWLDAAAEETSPIQFAYTLQVGRVEMEERLSILFRGIEDLQHKLSQWIEGGEYVEDCRQKNSKKSHSEITKILNDKSAKLLVSSALAEHDLQPLAILWTFGIKIDWNKLYNVPPKRIPLPTYPFCNDEYWISQPQRTSLPNLLQNNHSLHPLLHQNTSDLHQQRFSSTFTGREFFLADHRIKGRAVLPAAVYIEMAAAAASRAAGPMEPGNRVELKNLVWPRPFGVNDEPKTIAIGLEPHENGEIGWQVYSFREDAEAQETLHCQGSAVVGTAAGGVPALDIEALKTACSRLSLTADQCYKAFKTAGMDYGPSHRGLEKLYVGKDRALAKLSLPAVMAENKASYWLHPALLDAALQASILLLSGGRNGGSPDRIDPVLPFAVRKVEIFGAVVPEMWAMVVRDDGGNPSDQAQKLDIDMCDSNGKVCVRICGFSTRALEDRVAGPAVSQGQLMLHPVWQEKAVEDPGAASAYGRHLILLCGSEDATAKHVQTKMESAQCLTLQVRGKSLARRYENYAVQVFEHIQKIVKAQPKHPVLIQVIVFDRSRHAVHTGLHGLLKTAHLENPKLIGQLIQVQPGQPSRELVKQLRENSAHPMDERIRYHRNKRYVAGWLEMDLCGQLDPGLPWKHKGVYLITGGAGGLGLLMAEEIVRQTRQATLILTGRSQPNKEKRDQLNALGASGALVVYKSVDVTQGHAVRGLIQSITKDFGYLNGIIHGAGVISDNFILNKTTKKFQKVLAPKVAGLAHLDRAGKDLSLDFFILFSSFVGVYGNVGQCDYACANAFMDAYAAYRNELVATGKRSGRTVSINWPLWRKGGMRVDTASEKMMRQRTGMSAMETNAGLQALYQALASDQSQVMVMNGRIAALRKKIGLSSTRQPQQTVQISNELKDEVKIASSDLTDKVQTFYCGRSPIC